MPSPTGVLLFVSVPVVDLESGRPGRIRLFSCEQCLGLGISLGTVHRRHKSSRDLTLSINICTMVIHGVSSLPISWASIHLAIEDHGSPHTVTTNEHGNMPRIDAPFFRSRRAR